jgi:pimeloyl-ACP methyl ester carboxylesterase
VTRRPVRHVVYLHGFASSPASSKAQRFGRELEAIGVGFSCPDFNVPAFESLTVTRMIEQTREAVAAAPDGPVLLMGSSLGGFVALHAAARDRSGRIDRLILLAPAVEFGGNRLQRLGDAGIDEWRRTGHLRVFHYGDQAEREIGFGLYADAAGYDAFGLDLTQPAHVWQGTRDETVSPASVERWAQGRSNVFMHLVDDDHQLAASMDAIWAATGRIVAGDEGGGA